MRMMIVEEQNIGVCAIDSRIIRMILPATEKDGTKIVGFSVLITEGYPNMAVKGSITDLEKQKHKVEQENVSLAVSR